MTTLHEKLISGGARTDKPVQAKTAQAEAVEIDSAGVEKLASILAGVQTPNATLRALLEKTAWALRTLSVQKDYLVGELAGRMQHEDAAKVAQDLVKREIISQDDVAAMTEKVAKLKNLGSLKEAIELVHKPKKELPLGTVEKSAAQERGETETSAEIWLKKDPAAQFLLESAGLR